MVEPYEPLSTRERNENERHIVKKKTIKKTVSVLENLIIVAEAIQASATTALEIFKELPAKKPQKSSKIKKS